MGESCARERRARLIQPIDYFLVAWFVLVAISTIWVGVDQFRHNPEPAVMKWGFFFNTQRPHESLEDLTPAVIEQIHYAHRTLAQAG